MQLQPAHIILCALARERRSAWEPRVEHPSRASVGPVFAPIVLLAQGARSFSHQKSKSRLDDASRTLQGLCLQHCIDTELSRARVECHLSAHRSSAYCAPIFRPRRPGSTSIFPACLVGCKYACTTHITLGFFDGASMTTIPFSKSQRKLPYIVTRVQ